MQREQAYKLGRTLTVIATVALFTGGWWSIIPGGIGLALVWYGSTE